MEAFIIVISVGDSDGRHIAETIGGTVFKRDNYKDTQAIEQSIREELQETWGIEQGVISVYPISEYVNELNDIDDDYQNPNLDVIDNWFSYVYVKD